MGFLKRWFGREHASWQTPASPTSSSSSFSVPPIASAEVHSHVLTGAEAQQAVQAIENATGMDIDGDGRVGGTAAAPSGPDVVSQLERLAALRDSGALTPEEFERQKARLLGS